MSGYGQGGRRSVGTRSLRKATCEGRISSCHGGIPCCVANPADGLNPSLQTVGCIAAAIEFAAPRLYIATVLGSRVEFSKHFHLPGAIRVAFGCGVVFGAHPLFEEIVAGVV